VQETKEEENEDQFFLNKPYDNNKSKEKDKERKNIKKYEDILKILPLLNKIEWFEKPPNSVRTLPGKK
jgi:hypothetical protein